jgi:hypothetical protein
MERFGAISKKPACSVRPTRKSPAEAGLFLVVKTTKGMGEFVHGQTKGYQVLSSVHIFILPNARPD